MGAPRRKTALVARRRPGDDGDDDASVVQDDSLSEPSVPSDVDDDADGEGSESSAADTQSHKQNGKANSREKTPSAAVSATDARPHFDNKVADTELMLNGLTIADGSEQVEEIHFGEAQGQPVSATVLGDDGSEAATKPESMSERRRREHEEYKKRRDADPAFVPNRGGFYMHDERSPGGAQATNGFKNAPRGRGKGRGGFSGNIDNAAPAEEGPWTHDLHETLVDSALAKAGISQTAAQTAPEHQLRPAVQPLSNPPPNRTFSSSTQVGIFQLRVLLPGMQDPIVFSSVPCMQHTRLPHHRPPLRRDKPVRISLPDKAPMYIFPAVDRSFIFIPRALRPNQQGFGRIRGRGSLGGPGAFRSGRNSIYGGSVYSPSVAMSRRSSFARERDGMVSPAMSVMSRMTGMTGMTSAGVRLQGGTPNQGPTPVHFGQQTPYKPVAPMNVPQSVNYSNIPMHQPRPQKAVTVADIEPGTHNYQQPQPMQQPFAHQFPSQFGDPGMSRRTSYPSQRGTPLSNIPERAIHAQPFQPYPQGQYHMQMGPQMAPPPLPQQAPQQQMYYPPQQYPGNMYYYPQAPQQPGPAPPPAQYNPYMAPMQQQAPPAQDASSQQGTVAHESNGMVFYYDQTQLAADAAAQQASMPYQQNPYGNMGGNYMMPPQRPMYYPPPPS